MSPYSGITSSGLVPAASRHPSERLAVSIQDLHLKWKANQLTSADVFKATDIRLETAKNVD